MAHKVLVGGTGYAIKGGKTLIGGTGYNIKGGRTLIDGTAYKIAFARPCTIKISAWTYSEGGADVSVNDNHACYVDGFTGDDTPNEMTIVVNYGDIINVVGNSTLLKDYTTSAFQDVNINSWYTVFTAIVVGDGTISFEA